MPRGFREIGRDNFLKIAKYSLWIMKVVLSIKPKYANKIFDGTKKYEFRKAIFKNEKIKTVIVYASSPVQQVIGEFEIETILNHDIDTLWGITQDYSGISEDYF